MCGCLSCAPKWGPGLQPRHVPLTGNRTDNPLVCRLALNLLSHTSQGDIFLKYIIKWVTCGLLGINMYLITKLCCTILGKYMRYTGRVSKDLLTMVAAETGSE